MSLLERMFGNTDVPTQRPDQEGLTRREAIILGVTGLVGTALTACNQEPVDQLPVGQLSTECTDVPEDQQEALAESTEPAELFIVKQVFDKLARRAGDEVLDEEVSVKTPDGLEKSSVESIVFDRDGQKVEAYVAVFEAPRNDDIDDVIAGEEAEAQKDTRVFEFSAKADDGAKVKVTVVAETGELTVLVMDQSNEIEARMTLKDRDAEEGTFNLKFGPEANPEETVSADAVRGLANNARQVVNCSIDLPTRNR